jgi:hypothetical protein
LRQGNFWELARLHARQGWEAILGPNVRGESAKRSAADVPALYLKGNWWQRHKLRQLAKRLWRLSYSAEPVWISDRRWRRVEDEIRLLKSAFANGDLQVSG